MHGDQWGRVVGITENQEPGLAQNVLPQSALVTFLFHFTFFSIFIFTDTQLRKINLFICYLSLLPNENRFIMLHGGNMDMPLDLLFAKRMSVRELVALLDTDASVWKDLSGCGPTVASNISAHLFHA